MRSIPFYPLEGVWDLAEKGKHSSSLNKDEFAYTIMIRQPDFVTEDTAKRAFASVRQKKKLPFLEEAVSMESEEGLCVQMMHIGSFDSEPASFEKMREFPAGQLPGARRIYPP